MHDLTTRSGRHGSGRRPAGRHRRVGMGPALPVLPAPQPGVLALRVAARAGRRVALQPAEQPVRRLPVRDHPRLRRLRGLHDPVLGGAQLHRPLRRGAQQGAGHGLRLGRSHRHLGDGPQRQQRHVRHLRQGVRRGLGAGLGCRADRAVHRGDRQGPRCRHHHRAGPEGGAQRVRRVHHRRVRRSRLPGLRERQLRHQRRPGRLRRQRPERVDLDHHHPRLGRPDLAHRLQRHLRHGPRVVPRTTDRDSPAGSSGCCSWPRPC